MILIDILNFKESLRILRSFFLFSKPLYGSEDNLITVSPLGELKLKYKESNFLTILGVTITPIRSRNVYILHKIKISLVNLKSEIIECLAYKQFDK